MCDRPYCCAEASSSECLDDNENAACHYSEASCGECGGVWVLKDGVAGELAADDFADTVIRNPPSLGSQPPPPSPSNNPPVPIPSVQVATALPLPPTAGRLGENTNRIPPNYSERIVIPNPPEPPGNPRTSCPHLQDEVLSDWHDASTWPDDGIPSTTNQDVTLPANTRIVLRQSPNVRLGLITIPPSSALIIGESTTGIALDVTGFNVQGDLVVGSETCRVETPVTMTLHGSRPNNVISNVPVPTYKGIAVTGRLELHGKRYFRTWTRLAETARPGDRQVVLQHAVNWEAGQEIVLVTTAMKDSREWHQNEVHVIRSVDGKVVSLQENVQHTHLAVAGYQAEVGLLSRSIIIQGSAEDSEPTDPDPLNCSVQGRFGDSSGPCPYTEITGFGGHVIIHNGGKGYVEGVEFYRMGMTNALGRYPIHFHLLDDSCTDCYVDASSFHHSFYRCVSIHGTNRVRVSENVAYDVTGFCYYLEDGVEEDNTLSFNLASLIHSIGPDPVTGGGQQTDVYQQNDRLTLPADVTAAGFYITNVHNNLIGNSASGVSSLC